MLRTLAVANYRSLRSLVAPLGPLNVVTGPNGSGKSSLYRALRLLADTAQGTVVASLAREGGLESTLWAGPETITRRMKPAELSDGTLRYVLWIAALLTPRPPSLMVLNEPETSLHPDLLPALARLIGRAAAATQVWVVSHSSRLIAALESQAECNSLVLEKELSETRIAGLRDLDAPPWDWPPR